MDLHSTICEKLTLASIPDKSIPTSLYVKIGVIKKSKYLCGKHYREIETFYNKSNVSSVRYTVKQPQLLNNPL